MVGLWHQRKRQKNICIYEEQSLPRRNGIQGPISPLKTSVFTKCFTYKKGKFSLWVPRGSAPWRGLGRSPNKVRGNAPGAMPRCISVSRCLGKCRRFWHLFRHRCWLFPRCRRVRWVRRVQRSWTVRCGDAGHRC